MANILTLRFFKKKAILLKAETTVGTDPVPTGLANWIEARNVQFTPMEAETADRNIELPTMGNAGKVQVATWAKLSFDVLLAGSGAAGTAPKIGPALLACAFAETVSAGVSVAYNLVSSAFGAATLYINIDGTLHKLIGSRGNVSVGIAAKGIPVLKFAFDAAYVAPAASAMPAIDRTGWPAEEAVNATNTTKFTLNAVDFAFSAFDLNVGNQMARVNLPGPQAEIAITDRQPSGGLTILAPALGTFDPFALAQAGTVVTGTVTHGSAAGKKVQIDIKTRVTGADYDQVDNMLAYKLTLEPIPAAGDDEIAITYL
ncbi:MAG TPA: hypothetical protein VJ576_02585 [Rhodocyclaceae bacterium]|nr:hypothetical protein [Rhodocyclaceae bacterium]